MQHSFVNKTTKYSNGTWFLRNIILLKSFFSVVFSELLISITKADHSDFYKESEVIEKRDKTYKTFLNFHRNSLNN